MFITGKVYDEDIYDAALVLNRVGKKRHLGVARWDNLLDVYAASGTVTVPVEIGAQIMAEPFYFLYEKIDTQEMLFIRPLKGEQWSIGDVYGFLGLSDFEDFKIGMPIITVEGAADLHTVKQYYKYCLSTNGAKMSVKQQYILSNLTKDVWLGYDNDEAGNTAYSNAKRALLRWGVQSRRLTPLDQYKDWGKMGESEWGRKMLERMMKRFINQYEKK